MPKDVDPDEPIPFKLSDMAEQAFKAVDYIDDKQAESQGK